MILRRQAIYLVLAATFALMAGNTPGKASSPGEIDANVNATLDHFFRYVPGGRDLANRAAGILVFPTVVKAGFGVGGEYGEGALQEGGRTVGYYNTAAASIGFQFGAEARSVIIMFMTPGAIGQFHRTDGFTVGVDASVAIIAVGAGGSVDTNNITSPVIGFILDPKGLMYNLTLEGAKISRMRM